MPTENADRRNLSRATLLRALAIFVPLFAFFLWFAFTFRIEPIPDGWNFPRRGTLPFGIATIASAFTACGLAVLISLYWDNRARMKTVLRFRRGKVLTALLLGAITPVYFIDWLPVVPGALVVMMLVEYFEGWPIALIVAVILAVPAFPIAALIISGVRAKLPRFAVFALSWWSFYFSVMLVLGYQPFGL